MVMRTVLDNTPAAFDGKQLARWCARPGRRLLTADEREWVLRRIRSLSAGVAWRPQPATPCIRARRPRLPTVGPRHGRALAWPYPVLFVFAYRGLPSVHAGDVASSTLVAPRDLSAEDTVATEAARHGPAPWCRSRYAPTLLSRSNRRRWRRRYAHRSGADQLQQDGIQSRSTGGGA